MIIHRTGYGLYYKDSDAKNIIKDCQRSLNNARKVYHHCNSNGDIIKSYVYNLETQKLIIYPTSEEHKRNTQTQRNIAKGKSQYND